MNQKSINMTYAVTALLELRKNLALFQNAFYNDSIGEAKNLIDGTNDLIINSIDKLIEYEY